MNGKGLIMKINFTINNALEDHGIQVQDGLRNSLSYLFLRLKDVTITLLGSPQLFTTEIFIIQPLWQVHFTDVYLRLSSNHINLVDPPQRTSIANIGTCRATMNE